MKRIIVTVILFCVFGLPCSVARAQAFPDGADLFIESVRYRAENHTLVHSLSYVTEQTYRMPTLSAEEIEKRVSEIMATLREGLKNNPKAHLWLDGAEEHHREQFMQASVLTRLTVKYKAPSFSRKLLSLQVERAVENPPIWEAVVEVIEANVVNNKSVSEGVAWHPQGRSAHVSNTQSYTETLLNFGRLQGPDVVFMEFALFQDTNIEKYEFSEKNIAKFKAERDKQLQAGQVKGLITVGTTTYDGNAKAFVVESSTGSTVIERYWIDVNRGYVCPLLQYYDKKGKLLSEYKSENYFLHEKSGLWFPQLYKEMTTNKDGKQEFKEYRIDKSSLDVNFPIADDEFLIEIPDGTDVIDGRKGKGSKRYKAWGDGVLSLGRNGLDLEKKNWLYATGEFSKAQPMEWWRIAGMAAGVLLILLGLYFRFSKKNTGT